MTKGGGTTQGKCGVDFFNIDNLNLFLDVFIVFLFLRPHPLDLLNVDAPVTRMSFSLSKKMSEEASRCDSNSFSKTVCGEFRPGWKISRSNSVSKYFFLRVCVTNIRFLVLRRQLIFR